MHDTLSGLISHNNHNLLYGAQNVLYGGIAVTASEVTKQADLPQVSYLATHYVGVLSISDYLAVAAALLVLSGLWRFFLDMKDRYSERKLRKKVRK